MCYSLAIKFMCCLNCGCSTFRYPMTDNREQIEMNGSILNQHDFYCLRCDMNKCKLYYKNDKLRIYKIYPSYTQTICKTQK